ncbi:transcriptional regulator [candidate division WWE3 bacterium CG_4_9_14_3_um_filter_39_7]|uniref:Transcriptional regulator n=1 Tax=candidate division WWE3 bacterium CG_4_9_14_3_um_filter_39_7 TaxID=1975080 RepID=A0A2M7X1V1_UNCKA|nr:MAG: transcriptional regulator [candidate division WWE3 bacterium CG_4_9_14_3_um_filter_39_7]
MNRGIVENNMHELRTQKGVTQEELAHSLEVTRQTIIAIEKGNYQPSIGLALLISEYFEKPVSEIFKLS